MRFLWLKAVVPLFVQGYLFYLFILFYKSNVYSAGARAYVTLHKQRVLTTSNDPYLGVHASLYSQSNVLLPIPSHTCRQVAVNQFVFGGDILLKCVYDEVFFSAR